MKECVPILPDLSSNIKNGNSLICREDIHGKELPIEVLCNIKPFEYFIYYRNKKQCINISGFKMFNKYEGERICI